MSANYLGTDLVATLTGLNVNDFSHLEVLLAQVQSVDELKSSRRVKETVTQSSGGRGGMRRGRTVA